MRSPRRASNRRRRPSSRVARLAPRAVSQSVVLRLRRLSTAARALARAAAVLGEADLRLAAGLADVDPRAAAVAADELADAGILEEGRPLRFIHPIVRAAVEADLSPGERAALHGAAARRLAHEGASADRIAAHLLATDPAGDDWVVESLRAAARTAVANGAPDSAVAHLRRARRGATLRIAAPRTSCSSLASPSPTRETRRPRLISMRRSPPQPT